jgi:hypothetical protein
MNTIFKKHIISLVVSIILSISLLIGLILFFSFIKNKMSKVIELKERIVTYQKNEKAFADEASQIKILQNKLTNIESKIITSEKIPSLLSTFETLAQSDNIDFEITSVQTPLVDEKTKLMIDFDAKGSYLNLQKFLNQIQHQSFQVNFSQLFIFSEQKESIKTVTNGTLPTNKISSQPVLKEKGWHSIATIEILSF